MARRNFEDNRIAGSHSRQFGKKDPRNYLEDEDDESSHAPTEPTPLKNSDTPTTKIKDKATQLLQGSNGAKQAPTESNAWDEVREHTHGNPKSWEEMEEVNRKRKKGVPVSRKEMSSLRNIFEGKEGEQEAIDAAGQATQVIPVENLSLKDKITEKKGERKKNTNQNIKI